MVLHAEVFTTYTNNLLSVHSTMSATNVAKYGMSLENTCDEEPEYTSCKCGVDYFDGTATMEIDISDERKEYAINGRMQELQEECNDFNEEYSKGTLSVTTNYPVTNCQPTLQNGILTISLGGTNFSATFTVHQENDFFYNNEVYTGFTQDFLDKYYQQLLSDEDYFNVEHSGNTITYQESANFLGHTATIEDNYTSAQSVCKALLSGEISIEELSL